MDSDCRGDLRVILFNASDAPFSVHSGATTSRNWLSPRPACSVRSSSEMESSRGDEGLGSTRI
ncbi:hypothetical protein ACOJBO_46115 [Rhizobium beringeri]